MHPKDEDKIASSVDPDKNAPSGSTLFAQIYLSENRIITLFPSPGEVIGGQMGRRIYIRERNNR